MFSFLFSHGAQSIASNLFASDAIGYFASGLAGYVGNEFERYLITNDQYKIVGPAFNGINVQTFCYGRDIPKVYGQVKLAGNIVWYSEIREEKHTKIRETGNLFKHKEYNDHYQYYASFAIILCEGVVDAVSRIWADDEEIFLNENNLKIYYGTEEQLPDPTITKYRGPGNVSAYRGLCYVVIRDFPLDPVRLTFPKFTFEVKRNIIKNTYLQKIRAVNIGPGYGECSYDTYICYKKFYSKFDHGIVYHEEEEPLNLNASTEKADALITLDNIAQQLSSLTWVSFSICWYINSTNIKDAMIYPTVEFKEWEYTHPKDWCVGKYNRQNARLALKDANGCFLYGGTPSDFSVVNFIKELKARNIKVMITPQLMVEDQSKSWRGNISGEARDLERFYDGEHGYNQFILHYAALFKDYADAFLIGSEFVELNKITIGNNYLNIQKLKNLAAKVKNIFKSRDVIVTYGADILEYERLTDLWNDDNIDVIGINAYFPLTQKFPDFATLSPFKKIWFTELGFPSIEQCQLDPKINKNGWVNKDYKVDYIEFEKSLAMSLERWSKNDRIERIFLYYYDIHPNIHLPETADPTWPWTHALNGKMAHTGVGEIPQDITKNLEGQHLIEFALNDQFVQGAIIAGIKTTYELLSVLSVTMNYRFYESNGKLIITNIAPSEDAAISDYKNILLAEQSLKISYGTVSNVKISYINHLKNYELDNIDNFSGDHGDVIHLLLPLVISPSYVYKLGYNVYQSYRNYHYRYKFSVPLQYFDQFSFNKIIINNSQFILSEQRITSDNEVQLVYIAI